MEFPEASIPPLVRRLPGSLRDGRSYRDAALFERQRVGSRPKGSRPSYVIWPDGASLGLDPFPERKGSRLPGRTPASQKTTWTH